MPAPALTPTFPGPAALAPASPRDRRNWYAAGAGVLAGVALFLVWRHGRGDGLSTGSLAPPPGDVGDVERTKICGVIGEIERADVCGVIEGETFTWDGQPLPDLSADPNAPFPSPPPGGPSRVIIDATLGTARAAEFVRKGLTAAGWTVLLRTG